MRLRSEAFDQGGDIPRRYTKDGDDLSPPLEWSNVPPQAQELALLLVDTRSREPRHFAHWVIYGIPPERRELPEGIAGHRSRPTDGPVTQGRNDADNVGYDGPQPPRGPAHEYLVRLLALEQPLNAEPGITRAELEERTAGHVVAEAELVGRYGTGDRPWR